MVLVQWQSRDGHLLSKAHWVRGSRGDYEMTTLCGGRIPEDASLDVLRHMEYYDRRCRECEAVISDLGRRLHEQRMRGRDG